MSPAVASPVVHIPQSSLLSGVVTSKPPSLANKKTKTINIVRPTSAATESTQPTYAYRIAANSARIPNKIVNVHNNSNAPIYLNSSDTLHRSFPGIANEQRQQRSVNQAPFVRRSVKQTTPIIANVTTIPRTTPRTTSQSTMPPNSYKIINSHSDKQRSSGVKNIFSSSNLNASPSDIVSRYLAGNGSSASPLNASPSDNASRYRPGNSSSASSLIVTPSDFVSRYRAGNSSGKALDKKHKLDDAELPVFKVIRKNPITDIDIKEEPFPVMPSELSTQTLSLPQK